MKKTVIKAPFQLIIFGASGDLAFLKLFPAIFDLYRQRRLPDQFQIVGYGRSKLSRGQFQELFIKSIESKFGKDLPSLTKLLSHLYYLSGSYEQPASFKELDNFCRELSEGKKVDQSAYFSVPPAVFKPLITNLARTLKKTNSSLKLVIEKPFGTSLKTAKELANTLNKFFKAKNIYLLDHFLGKIPVKSILQLRKENNIINQLLKGDLISNIQITAFETADIEQRVSYFDHSGIIRDMIQSHLLQILALITMDIPSNPSRESIHREKASLLAALRFSGQKSDLVTAQYRNYQKVAGVQKNSSTDTFAAVKLTIDRRNWFEVPIFIRTGKKLKQDLTRVVIEFKRLPFQKKNAHTNKLIFEMKPQEKMEMIVFEDARPNQKMTSLAGTISLAKNLACVGDECLSDYGILILDILNNNHDFFLEIDEVLACWKVTDGILRTKAKSGLYSYAPGSNGPKEQLELLRKNHLKWYEN